MMTLSLLTKGGVLIAINPNSKIKYINHMVIDKGRALLMNVKWNKIKITILNIYLHSGNDPKTIKDRNTLITKILNNSIIKKAKNLIIGGDWNCIRHPADTNNPNHIFKSRTQLENLEESLKMHDRVLHLDNENCYTRTSNNSDTSYMSRLDPILISNNLIKYLAYINKEDAGLESDHDTLIIKLTTKTDYPAKAQWYFPNQLLANPDYVTTFTKAWKEEWGNIKMTNKKWEQCKTWIRKFTIDWKKSTKNTTNELKSLKKDLSKMKYFASKSTIRSTRRENTIRNIKAKISSIEIQNQKNKHEDYTYLHQMHTEKANRPYFGIERKMRMTHDRIISELVNPYSNKIYTKSKQLAANGGSNAKS